MLNDIDFDYPDLGLPNLVWAKDKTQTYNKRMQISAKLAPLAFEAAKKFPRWKFVGSDTWEYPDYLDITRFTVYENREKIGNISTTQFRQGTKYVIGNERIKKLLKRGGAKETGDLKKALKLMAKSFGGRTNAEKLAAASAQLSGQLHGGNQSRAMAYTSAMGTLYRYTNNYVLANFEEVSAAAIAAGAKPNQVGNIPGLKEDYDTTKQIAEAYSSLKGAFVLINGGDYLVQDKQDLSPLVLSSDQLPSDLKGKLGMLKLLEDNHFMKDVGYRLNATTFFVMQSEP
jgi:hypothetical protein